MRNHRTSVATAAAAFSVAAVLVGCSPSAQDSDNPIYTQEAPVTESEGPGNGSEAPDADAAAPFIGTWIDPDGLGYLTFTEDGAVRGSDACNGIRSTYSVDGGTATVEPFATTMMVPVAIAGHDRGSQRHRHRDGGLRTRRLRSRRPGPRGGTAGCYAVISPELFS